MDAPRRPPVFTPAAVLAVKLALFAALLLVLLVLAWLLVGDPASTTVGATGEPVQQPIPFSHRHHVGDDGLDCRYCHTTVETQAQAGLPSTTICLGCHSQLYADAGLLQPLRDSAASGRPIAWQRVHLLPDHVYFNHAVHVARGVGCVECHGRVDRMPITWRAQRLDMQWCIGCHRDPAPHLRPRSQVFSMGPAALSADEAQLLRRLLESERRRTDCSTCHR